MHTIWHRAGLGSEATQMYSYTIIVLIKVATVLRAEFLHKNARRCNRMGFVASASASVTRCHISLFLFLH